MFNIVSVYIMQIFRKAINKIIKYPIAGVYVLLFIWVNTYIKNRLNYFISALYPINKVRLFAFCIYDA